MGLVTMKQVLFYSLTVTFILSGTYNNSQDVINNPELICHFRTF